MFPFLKGRTLTDGLVAVKSVEGPYFRITKVARSHMGSYLCIASNGIPPSVSKRIMLIVHCMYKANNNKFFLISDFNFD